MPSPSSDFGRLAAIARSQDGLITAAQARAEGVSRGRLQGASQRGELERIHTQVYRFAAASPERRQLIRAATLQVPNSWASHESALALGGIDRIPAVVALTVGPRRASSLPGVRIHRFGDLHPDHTREVDGVPTTTIERAVIDVAAVFRPTRLEHLIDVVTIEQRLTTIGAISRTLIQVNRKGRLGLATLQNLLGERRPNGPVERSRLERRFDALLAGTSLTDPLHEFPLPSLAPAAGLVDRAWPEAKLIVEIDGRSWHSRERDMRRDRERDREAMRMGWLTVRFLDEEIAHAPDVVVADVEAIHHRRVTELAA